MDDQVLHEKNASGQVSVTRGVMVAMRDGVRLATDIYQPAVNGQPLAGAYPVLLERTPYDKRGTNHAERTAAAAEPVSKPESALRLARSGYVVVIQDCRGRFESEGAFSKYVYEAEDGVDTLDWIRSQPWCNGHVGTFGLSYGAHVQSAMACLNPPGLSAMLMESGAFSDAYQSGIRQGGAFELKQATWAYRHALSSPDIVADPKRFAQLEAQDIRDWFAHMPWSPGHSPISAAPEYESYLFEQWRSGLFDAEWQRVGLYAKGYYPDFPDTPMLFMTGWYDPYARSAIENYSGLSALKTSPICLLIGPWTHGQRSLSYAGDVDFGPKAVFDVQFPPDFFAFRQAWFDHWMKAGPAPLPHRVNLFVMGGGSGRRIPEGRIDHGGHWIVASSWPPADVREMAYYLDIEGGLSTQAPTVPQAQRSWQHDPVHPVPTIGGAITSGAPVMEAGAYDQREGPEFFGSVEPYRALVERPDVLVFQTEPLSAPVDVIGVIRARFYVASSCVDSDVTIKLVDVYPPSEDYPHGYALNLAHGILRLRYREGFDHETRMEPGEIYPVTVEGFPTANRFAAGHRIRLEVASSNFPHFDVNPNSGEAEGFADYPQIAHNRIFMDAEHPSRLWLPVVDSDTLSGEA